MLCMCNHHLSFTLPLNSLPILLPFLLLNPLQAWISRARVESFSLTADLMYVSQNAPRIMRAIFEICLRRKWSSMADTTLTLAR